MLIVETADMLQAPLFTAEALLRAHGTIRLTHTQLLVLKMVSTGSVLVASFLKQTSYILHIPGLILARDQLLYLLFCVSPWFLCHRMNKITLMIIIMRMKTKVPKSIKRKNQGYTQVLFFCIEIHLQNLETIFILFPLFPQSAYSC